MVNFILIILGQSIGIWRRTLTVVGENVDFCLNIFFLTISFKPGVVIGTTEPYSLVPV